MVLLLGWASNQLTAKVKGRGQGLFIWQSGRLVEGITLDLGKIEDEVFASFSQ